MGMVRVNKSVVRMAVFPAIVLITYCLSPAQAEDKFKASETNVVVVPAPKPKENPPPPKAEKILLRPAEIREVYHYLSKEGEPERAFYLPPEGTSVAQVVIEKDKEGVTYYLKGLVPGKTVGGVVERAWLDKTGLAPKGLPEEARIQRAVKAKPYLITVDTTPAKP
jgi:hypothetical protein